MSAMGMYYQQKKLRKTAEIIVNKTWNCASQAWDAIAKAKQFIDRGEINSDSDEFQMARINLSDAQELLDTIMAETCKKSSDVEGKPVRNGDLDIFDPSKLGHESIIHNSIHFILARPTSESFQEEMLTDVPEQHLQSANEHIAE